MSGVCKLWADENGFVLSTEAVLLGSVAAVGVTAALITLTSSANDNLSRHAFSIRGFDQSFDIPAQHSSRSHVAGSQFQQSMVTENQATRRLPFRQSPDSGDQFHGKSAGRLEPAFPDPGSASSPGIEDARRQKQPQRRKQNAGR